MNASQLIEYGAINAKMEDSYGDTYSGWWLDGQYLGESIQDATYAIEG
jgi:hypothetical protein